MVCAVPIFSPRAVLVLRLLLLVLVADVDGDAL
jgi:hypothetical protein